MPKEQLLSKLKPVLKEGATDSLYQSTFLPIFQDAETRIKLLVLSAFLSLSSKRELMMRIAHIISVVDGKIPKDLNDRKAYMDGLRKRSVFYVARYYDAPKIEFKRIQTKLLRTNPPKNVLLDTPQQVMDVLTNPRNLWPEAKGTPYILDYAKEVNKKMDEFAEFPMTTYEPGKKPISLWQKAELDVRYNKQMQMLKDLRDRGVQYAWTSSHANCSKRCEKWQGKLMDLNSATTMTGFRVGKKDGHWVYSLTDIMAQTDKYGYHNNIICGFNCRHRLIAYDPKQSEPTQYSEKEVAKQRAIEEKIRQMEREIRLQKTRLLFYEKVGEKNIVKNLKNHIKMLVERYKNYCERNGYAWFEYRIRIREGSNKYL